MTLKPTDMLVIQSAIDKYERKFPHRPTPSPEVALAWLLGRGRLAGALEQLKSRWVLPKDERSLSENVNPNMTPWVRGVLVVGGWSAGAVVAISLFFFGALVGGFK